MIVAKEDGILKKSYEPPELDFFMLEFEDMLTNVDDSRPNDPIEIGDPGEDT